MPKMVQLRNLKRLANAERPNTTFACPACGARESAIVDSRPVGGDQRRRRYACLNCEHRFTTFETVDGISARATEAITRARRALVSALQAIDILPKEPPDA